MKVLVSSYSELITLLLRGNKYAKKNRYNFKRYPLPDYP